MKTSRVLFFAATSVLLSSVIPLSAWGAAPKVNGLFYGDGDTNNYPVVPYASSVNDSKLYVTYINGTLYVALVVNRTINDNVFGNRDYTSDAGWNPAHTAKKLTDSEFAEFSLTVGTGVGEQSWNWLQGYAGQPDNPDNNTNATWISDHTVAGGGGTPPPALVSASSFMWNLNNYATNPAPAWNMNVNGTSSDVWKSPFETSAPDIVIGLEGYPGPGRITWSPTYQWEWAMVYEWSLDLTQFGSTPVFVVTGSSHHSPSKNGDENDVFPPGEDPAPLMDFGDLPAPYNTTTNVNGARHIIDPSGAQLGAGLDNEIDGQPHLMARGDDLAGVDDEDGIALLTPLIPGGNAVIRVTAGKAGFLSAFIDWNNDGTLDTVTLVSATGPASVTTGVIGDRLLATNGVFDLTIAVPSYATNAMPARFRYTTASGQGGNSPTGQAASGEVEDYIWHAAIGDVVWHDLNANGVQNSGEAGMTNIIVRLLNASSNVVATTVTDAAGFYLFTNLLPAAYLVEFVAPTQYVFTVRNAVIATDLTDSDAYPATGRTPPVYLPPGSTNLTMDAGLFRDVPTAAAVLIRAYATAEGVVVEFQSIEEAGGKDMILYLFRDGQWVEVGRQASAGEGNHRYVFHVPGLKVGDICNLMVRDDEGQYHTAYALTVGTFTAEAVLMEKNGLWLQWASIPDRTYEIQRTMRLGGTWQAVKTVTAIDFQTRMFVSFEPGQPSGFFKIVMLP